MAEPMVWGRLATYGTALLFFTSLFFLFSFDGGYVELGGYLQFIPDKLGLLLSTYILLVSLVVHRYSINYMADDPGYGRYFLLLFIMTLSLVTLVLSANLLLIATCWNLMGILLYLFLVHNYRRREAHRWANWALATHLISDLLLASAIWVIYRETGSLFLGDIFSSLGSGSHDWVKTAGVLLMLSAVAKSAQFPFHLWLVYSMEGPTPVSALMHAGIVNAGAFLINRFSPLFAQDGTALQIAFFIGSVTAVLGSALMLVQSDVKKTLGYSTVGQMGYMVMELGVGAFALAVYHMMTHGIFKATLFLISGNVIHGARKDPNIPRKEIYDSIVGRAESSAPRFPLWVMILLTLLVPLMVVVLAHLFVEKDIIKKETALILLFFGWVTGVQVLVSAFKVGREKPLQTLFLVVASMVVFMMGYVLFGHGLQSLLYTDEFADLLYERAFGSPLIFTFELVFLGLLALLGWIFLWISARKGDIPLWTKLYSHLVRDLHMVSLYDSIGKHIRKGVSFLKIDPSPVALTAGSIFILGIILLHGPRYVLPALFMPVFPLSLILIKLMRATGYLAFLPLIGGAMVTSYFVGDPPEVFHLLASLTFLIHSLRMINSTGLRDLSYEVYGGVMAIGWILSGGHPVAMLWLSLVPLTIAWSSYMVRKRFGTCSSRILSGIWDYSPLLAMVIILTALFVTGTAPLPSFLFKLELLTDESFLLFLMVLGGWFFLSMSVIPSAVRMVSGMRIEAVKYIDLRKAEFLFASGLFLFSALWGLLHLGGVL